MAAYCKNCGTELIAGQRFCRMCGAPISESQREELPTKIFTGERKAGGSAAASATASQPGASTDPFSPFQQQSTASQPPVPQQTTPLYLPPDQATPRNRTTMFLVVGLIGMALLVALLLLWNYRQPSQLITTPPHPPHAETGVPPPPDPPPPPEDAPGATLLDESDAVETAKETVITKTYPLGSGATFSIKGMNGNVEIEGWDEAEAEVKVIKRGGSVEQRKSVQVKSAHNKDLLSFQTSPIGGGDVEVLYEVKLPRGLRQVEIKTVNATVKVERIAAAIEVKSQNGSVVLEETSGSTAIKLVNGQIKADYEGVELEGAQELSTVNGRIEVKLDGDMDADIDAKTVSGSIELDGDFGFKVERKIVGQQASGRIGTGGERLSIGTVNGPIKISK